MGLVLMIPGLLQVGGGSFAGELTYLAGLLYFLYGSYSGVLGIRRIAGWEKGARWFWWLQVPFCSSSALSCSVISGAGILPYLRFGGEQFGVGFQAHVGSWIRWSYGQATSEVMVGANIVALTIAIYLQFWAAVQR